MKTRVWLVWAAVLAVLATLAVGCREQVGVVKETEATAKVALPATATRAPAMATLPPTTTALPDAAALLAGSQAALDGMVGVAMTMTEVGTQIAGEGVPAMEIHADTCQRLTASGHWEVGAFLAEVDTVHPGGFGERTVCEGEGPDVACYTQVGAQPWYRDVRLEPLMPWPRARSMLTARATTVALAGAGTGELVVAWSGERMMGALDLEAESFLDEESLAPQREVLRWYRDGVLLSARELVYRQCAAGEAEAMTAVATVTPAPTVVPNEEVWGYYEAGAPLPGALYVPEGEGPFPAVVVLHGSEGRVDFSSQVARRLASGGFVALALCYFGCEGTPATLRDVEISPVGEAASYLRGRPDTLDRPVGVVGFSRGAELALISGALGLVDGPVAAVMGSPWVAGSIPSGGIGWLYQGEPLPFVVIPVEEIAGPVLILHGQNDHLWPLSRAYFLEERLAVHRRDFELVVYPYRGHELGGGPDDVLERVMRWMRV